MAKTNLSVQLSPVPPIWVLNERVIPDRNSDLCLSANAILASNKVVTTPPRFHPWKQKGRAHFGKGISYLEIAVACPQPEAYRLFARPFPCPRAPERRPQCMPFVHLRRPPLRPHEETITRSFAKKPKSGRIRVSCDLPMDPPRPNARPLDRMKVPTLTSPTPPIIHIRTYVYPCLLVGYSHSQ